MCDSPKQYWQLRFKSCSIFTYYSFYNWIGPGYGLSTNEYKPTPSIIWAQIKYPSPNRILKPKVRLCLVHKSYESVYLDTAFTAAYTGGKPAIADLPTLPIQPAINLPLQMFLSFGRVHRYGPRVGSLQAHYWKSEPLKWAHTLCEECPEFLQYELVSSKDWAYGYN